jgi:hypothetical protein
VITELRQQVTQLEQDREADRAKIGELQAAQQADHEKLEVMADWLRKKEEKAKERKSEAA